MEKHEAIGDPLEVVEKVVRKIKTSNKVDFESIQKLEDSYHDAGKGDLRKVLGDYLAKNQLGVLFKRQLATLEKSSPELRLLRKVCWNYTHASVDLCQQFVRVGLIPLLLHDLQQHIDSKDMSSENVMGILAIIYNCAKATTDGTYRKSRPAIEIILAFTKAADRMIQMVATLTLSYIVDDENNELISTDDSVIENIINLLKTAMSAENHKYEGWTVYELVAGLKKLAANDVNSAAIVKRDIVPTMLNLIQDGNDREREIAGDTLWMLTFQEENKHIISQNEKTMKILRDVSSEEGPATQAALGVLWVLDSKKRVAETSNTSHEKQRHIMISYQWDNQDLMDRVHEELTQRGYDVWIDIHAMSGSILEAMAGAVEMADIVLIGMSQKYKDSPNCRTEAEYAYNLHKHIIPLKVEQDYKADGWLGALAGTKLYVNFGGISSFHGESFQKKMVKLIVEIEAKRLTSPKKSATPVASSSHAELPPAPKTSQISAPPQSTSPGVEAWMKRHNITTPKLINLTFEELQFLRNLKLEAPNVYYKFLCGDLKMVDFEELLKISKAMDDLES